MLYMYVMIHVYVLNAFYRRIYREGERQRVDMSRSPSKNGSNQQELVINYNKFLLETICSVERFWEVESANWQIPRWSNSKQKFWRLAPSRNHQILCSSPKTIQLSTVYIHLNVCKKTQSPKPDLTLNLKIQYYKYPSIPWFIIIPWFC